MDTEDILASIRNILEDEEDDEYTVISDAAANKKIIPIGDRLIKAAGNGGLDIVKELLEKGAAGKADGTAGGSALAAAAHNGHRDIIKTLIESGVDVNARDNDGDTVLMNAVGSGKPDVVKMILDAGADVNVRDNNGRTVLMKAAGSGDFNLIRTLIDKGADVNVKSNRGETMLMAAAGGGDPEVFRLFLDKGQDVDAKDEDAKTALMYAAWGGNVDIVKALLEAGADVNAKDNSGRTPLMAAVRFDNPDIARLLLDKGADVNAKEDRLGWTALTGCGDAAETFGILIRAGADVNARDNDGWTVLLTEAGRGHIENVKSLIAAGADAAAATSHGKTALMCLIQAVPYDANKIAKMLEEGMRADINAVDNDGKTVLMYAAEARVPDFCRFLIKSGADVGAKDKNGRSVLHYAAKKCADDVLKLLTEEYGANMNAPDNDGDTPAVLLLKKGGYEKAIGEFGLDVNVKFKDGGHVRTPLMKAAAEGNLRACRWLSDKGADIGAANEEGETAFSLALRGENSAVCFLLGEKLGMSREDVLKKFGLKNKAFFREAVEKNDLAMCKKLFEYGADVNDGDDGSFVYDIMKRVLNEKPLLITAIEHGYRDMCFWLIDAGADVNKTGPDKRTPLQTAEDYDQDEIAAYLREHGARLRIPDDDLSDAVEKAAAK